MSIPVSCFRFFAPLADADTQAKPRMEWIKRGAEMRIPGCAFGAGS